MKKLTKIEELTLHDVLHAMTPGERYTLHQISKLSGVGIAATRVLLAGSITERSIRTGFSRQRAIYWRPSEEELALERQNATDDQQSRAGLKGYDASLRRLQELSMLTRPRSPER